MPSTIKPVCLADYESLAFTRLDKNARDYYKSGADDEETLSNNVGDYRKFRIRPQMMVDVSKITMETTLLGQKVSAPIGISSTAMQRMAHPDGEVAVAKAAGQEGICYMLSTIATASSAEVKKQVPEGLKWFQLYIFNDRSITEELVLRVEKEGYAALVLTVDTPTFGCRRADVRNKFKLPQHLRMSNFEGLSSSIAQEMNKSVDGSGLAAFSHKLFDSSLTWEDVRWLKSITSLPIIAKGLLSGSDAELAIEAGCDAIVVSNHGARQLDGVSSTIMALPEIVAQVSGRVEVYVDGGIRTGTDILKALALGAKAVFIGRPALYGLAVNGEAGVSDVIAILKKELHLAMQLSGVTDIRNIPAGLVVHENYYSRM